MKVSINAAIKTILASATLGSGVTVAKHVDFYVVGPAAQRTFWRAELQLIANCAAKPGTHTWKGRDIGFGSPDFSFTACIAGPAPFAPGVSSGDTVVLHYSADLDSVWSVATTLGAANLTDSKGHPYPKQHLFLSYNTFDCAGTTEIADGTCGNGTLVYALETTPQLPGGTACANAGQDAICGGNPPELSLHNPDMAVFDLELVVYASPDNWPTGNSNYTPPEFAALGAAPTQGALNTAFAGIGTGQLNGQVFAMALNKIPGGNPTNISSASLQSILQGTYQTWSQVPEVGTKDTVGTPITLCRYGHGSGSEAVTSLIFTGTECGLANAGGILPENGATVILNMTVDQMKTCVNTHSGAIGFFSVLGNLPSGGDTFTIPEIDGVEVNSHNAAAGFYKYASQTFGVNTSVEQTTLTAEFLLLASDNSILSGILFEVSPLGAKEIATQQPNGQFHVTAGLPGAYFTLPIGNNGLPSNNIAALTASPAVPNGLQANNGNSCTVFGNTNNP